jgi:type I restriction enzyme S subunit
MSDTQKDTKPNVPNLRFPGFEGEWECKQVKDIAPLQRGFDLPSQSLKEGMYPVVYSNGVMNYHREYKCEAPGLVTGRSGTIGKLTFIEEGKYWPHNTALWVTDFKNNYPKFIFYFYEHLDLSRFSSGSGVPTLNRNDVHAYKALVPSLLEQKRIASFLTLIDQRITLQNRVIEDLKQLKAAIGDQSIKLVHGRQISLGDVLVEKNEKSTRNNQYEVLSSTVTGIYSQREYFNKDIASSNNIGYKVVHRGDVVLSPQNLWMGNINYNEFFENGIVSPSYRVFSIRNEFDKRYVAFLLKTRKALWAYSLVSEQGASIVRRNLNLESFMEISFPIPSYNKQKEIGDIISAVNRKLRLEQKLLYSLSRQKRYLLRCMFI